MKKTLLLLLVIALLFNSCSKELNLTPDAGLGKKSAINEFQGLTTNGITKFVFTQADNPELNGDAEGVIINDRINVTVYADGISLTNLKPTIAFKEGALLNPLSGEARDFTGRVLYSYYDTELGVHTFYKVYVTLKPASERPAIYIAGYEYNSSNIPQAVYWKNNVKYVLTTNATAQGIAVKDNDVYVVGTINQNGSKAVYWKNGILNRLTITEGSYANAITISGDDIYISGTVHDPSRNKWRAVYWKNGVETQIDYAADQVGINSIYVHENDVYTTGETYINGNFIATYWKNNIKTLLNVSGNASSIRIVNSDFYIFTNSADGSYYFKNGLKTSTGISSDNGNFPQSTTIINNAIYVAGYFSLNGVIYPCYWKNGIKYELKGADHMTRRSYITDVNSNICIAGVYGNGKIIYWVNEQPYIINNEIPFYITSFFAK